MTFFLMALAVSVAAANILILRDLTDIGSRPPLPTSSPARDDSLSQHRLVRIGVVSRFAPNVIYAGYQPIMDYLNRTGTHRYELQLSTSYQDAVDRLRQGQVDASFLGAWIYGHLDADVDLPCIAAPLNHDGRSEFRAVLVTRADSDLTSLDQLAGRSVALPSPQSWSGNWLQNKGLQEAGLSVSDLDSLHHFDHHNTVVWQVLRGNFDAGVVKESVAARYSSEGLRTVAFSTPIPGPPLVARPGAHPGVFEEISRLLLALDARNEDDLREIETWTPEFSWGFTAVDRDQYWEAFHGKKPPR